MPQDAPTRPRKERKDNAEKRRRQLLDATLRSVVANGLNRTTLATVAAEAGLSQGVAVFYFKSKNGLLTEALRSLYVIYQEHWNQMVDDAGPDPLDQLAAAIRAEFAPEISGPDQLSAWFAFWGEQKFTPQYAEVSSQFDQIRSTRLRTICARLVGPEHGITPDELSDWIDTLTDGYWQRLQVFPGDLTREAAVGACFRLVGRLLPEFARRHGQGQT